MTLEPIKDLLARQVRILPLGLAIAQDGEEQKQLFVLAAENEWVMVEWSTHANHGTARDGAFAPLSAQRARW